MNSFQKVAAGLNSLVRPLINAPIIGRFLSRGIAEISYVGRKSGRTFSIPVSYKRRGDDVKIAVALPDKKGWWRNFYPHGGPIYIKLDGRQRTGIATAQRGENSVSVRIKLTPDTP